MCISEPNALFLAGNCYENFLQGALEFVCSFDVKMLGASS
jgi:hypothetical protein